MAIFFSFIVRASPSELHFVQLGRGERDKETLKVGISSGVMAGGTQFIGQKLGWIQCFIAGTLVATETGYVTIENIKVGDLVWAHDPETGETALKPVVQTFRNETTEWIHVTVKGETLTCTPEHPFYVPKKGWTSAIDLRAGDILVMLNGEYVVVEQVQHELLESPETTYNFEVEDYHTYYVSTVEVLVHNACSENPQKIRYTQDSISKKFRDGSSVDDMISGLKNGSITPDDVPSIQVFKKDGALYSLDNRRLYAFKQAGMNKINIKMVSYKNIPKWKLTSRNGGTSIRVR